MYDIKALYEAESVSHAAALLREHPQARIIAGGTDVLIRIREGRLPDCELVSIRKLDELRGVSLDPDETLRIGPLTSFSRITRDPLIRRHITALADAADQVGGPQIRNAGTIGGNICNGVSSADTASTLMAWDSALEYTGLEGIRVVPIEKHYQDAGKTALNHDELLTAILIPKQRYEGYYGHYIKYALRNAMDIAILGCSVNVRLSSQGVEDARISLGVAGPVPLRIREAENFLRGKPADQETIAAAAAVSRSAVNPRTSWRASREFRLHLAEELVKRALQQAVVNAGGAV